MRDKLKKGDFLIVAVVLLLAALSAWWSFFRVSGNALYAEVWQDGTLVERVLMTDSTDQTISLDGHNTIILSGRTAAITQADCPDQVCVRTGTLTRAGQSAVCLPHRVVLKLVGANTEIDAIVT